jgi:hypothetical protein
MNFNCAFALVVALSILVEAEGLRTRMSGNIQASTTRCDYLTSDGVCVASCPGNCAASREPNGQSVCDCPCSEISSCNKETYVIGGPNTFTCPKRSSSVQASSCETAATALGKTFSGINTQSPVMDCSDGEVFFGYHPSCSGCCSCSQAGDKTVVSSVCRQDPLTSEQLACMKQCDEKPCGGCDSYVAGQMLQQCKASC